MSMNTWYDSRLEDAFAYGRLLSEAVLELVHTEEFQASDNDPQACAERLECVNRERELGRNHGAIGTVRLSDELCARAIEIADDRGCQLDPPLVSDMVFAVSVLDHSGLKKLQARGPRNDDIDSRGACDAADFPDADGIRRFLGNYATLSADAIDMYLMRSSARADARNRFRAAGVEQASDDVYLYGHVAPNVHLVIGGNAFEDESGRFVTDDVSGDGISLYLTSFVESGYRPTFEVPIDEHGHMMGAVFSAGEVISRPNHEVPLDVADELQVSYESPFAREAVVSVVPVDGDVEALQLLNHFWSREGCEQVLAFENLVGNDVHERFGNSYASVSEQVKAVAEAVRYRLEEAGLSDKFEVCVHVPEKVLEQERDSAVRDFSVSSSVPITEDAGFDY